ncbi:MAG: NAD(P)H-dependent oxidoreductase subunit E [Bacteroidales bacterium]|nr:NAD(P)H-dependent oxidoreductase subunit E [Bacteroidales bacterium]
MTCSGACGLAPVALVDGKVYGRLAPANVKNIVNEYREMDKQ